MTYTVPPLPYAYDALEPHIDRATMEIHHDKHHQAYVDKVNAALEGTALLSTLFASSAAEFLRSHHSLPNLQAAAMIHGYTTAFWWAAGIFAVGLLIALLVLPAGRDSRQVMAESVAAP